MAHRPNTNLTATVRREAGFTLVELMIALFISGLVMAALVTIYTAQTRAYSKHDDIADIQQNLRGALAILPREIRLAGCDPEETGGPGILVATRNQLQFTLDVRGNAVNATSADGDTDDTDENIGYTLTARNNTTNATEDADSDNNGIIDSGGADWNWGINITPALGRQTGGGGGFQPLADNVEAIEFNYILANGSTTLAPSGSDLNDIRSVQVSLLARTSNPTPDFVHTASYTTASGAVWTPPQDNFRRRLILTTIHCRNLGY